MNGVEKNASGFVVDAAMLSDAFDIPADRVQPLMREGHITSRSEIGQDDDAGRWRITFFYNGRALRLTVDETGTVLGKASFPLDRHGA